MPLMCEKDQGKVGLVLGMCWVWR